VLRSFVDFEGATIDEGLLLWFPAPSSFTGEDVAELHLHGGRAIIDRLLDALEAMPGTRLAHRGEFSRRAVENGKLDLTRAEAIADLVDAETEIQRKQALKQYRGDLFQLAEGWRAELIKALAWAEAAIDFGEDEVPASASGAAKASVGEIVKEIQRLLNDGRRGEILREGLYLTVIGPPNAGKSSLINALAQRDVAIVSETPGTTRDVLEARLDLDGYPVIIADTAGLRLAEEPVEVEGVRRAMSRAEEGDAILLLLDGSSLAPFAGIDSALEHRADLTVWNKADLPWPCQRKGLLLSLKTGQGLDTVIKSIAAMAREKTGGEGAPVTRARHRASIAEANEALERALLVASPELMAEDLRLALRAIGKLTGAVDVEELLDVVFRDFCIGK
jgi:tRNA modification GTPase